MTILAVCFFIVSTYFLSQGIPAGDSGDLVTAAATLGIAHPPGYPLYTVLGWLLNHLPFLTPAWRVGLLSSLFHAIAIYLVATIVRRLTKSTSASWFAACVLMSNYLFFLYSITPEVFALLDFFIVLCVWLLIRFKETKQSTFFYVLCFVLGLSLTHHHVILFTFPALFYFLHKNAGLKYVTWYKAILLFIAGLTPYLYIAYPPHGNSMIVWNPAVSIENIIKLITRADYGTFQSAIVYGQLPIQRLLNIQTYAQYITLDFLWIGWVFVIMGVWHIIKRRNSIGITILHMVLFLGPFFYFYASFPLSYRFSLGTLERFLLPTYTLLSIVIGIGYAHMLQALRRKIPQGKYTHVLLMGISVIAFLYPVRVGLSTLQKCIGYNTDKTAQYVGEDILHSLPGGAILLVDRDTVLFTTQYVRYALKLRQDIIVLQGYKLNFEDQRNIMKDRFPELIFPPVGKGSYITEFMKTNSAGHRIFSYMKYDNEKGVVWEPHGIVYEYIKSAQEVDIDSVIEKQKALWDSMHAPQKGILKRYAHLILSDTQDIYTTARAEYGKYLLQANRVELAKYEFESAIAYGGDATLAQAYMYKGMSEAVLGHCDRALSDFMSAKNLSLTPIPENSYYIAVTYRDCVKDEKKANEYFREFKSFTSSKEVPLQSL